ncbi:MAG TPA: hypothetical protein VLJ79_26930, partial [Candidatus Binatia bacterium]|nr:hypothetical protein [Candidatus Binatia bacterium]
MRSRIAVKDVIEKAKSANEITLYLSRPLSPDFSEMLRQIVSCENHPAIEIVTEPQSVEYVE